MNTSQLKIVKNEANTQLLKMLKEDMFIVYEYVQEILGINDNYLTITNSPNLIAILQYLYGNKDSTVKNFFSAEEFTLPFFVYSTYGMKNNYVFKKEDQRLHGSSEQKTYCSAFFGDHSYSLNSQNIAVTLLANKKLPSHEHIHQDLNSALEQFQDTKRYYYLLHEIMKSQASEDEVNEYVKTCKDHPSLIIMTILLCPVAMQTLFLSNETHSFSIPSALNTMNSLLNKFKEFGLKENHPLWMTNLTECFENMQVDLSCKGILFQQLETIYFNFKLNKDLSEKTTEYTKLKI